jgi:hypothetical protein
MGEGPAPAKGSVFATSLRGHEPEVAVTGNGVTLIA